MNPDNPVALEESDLTGKIIGCAMRVHSVLGPGLLESVYQNALAHEVAKAGLKAERRRSILVQYDGVQVGEFFADMLVEDKIMLELKSNQTLVPANEVQLVNRLTATGSRLVFC